VANINDKLYKLTFKFFKVVLVVVGLVAIRNALGGAVSTPVRGIEVLGGPNCYHRVAVRQDSLTIQTDRRTQHRAIRATAVCTVGYKADSPSSRYSITTCGRCDAIFSDHFIPNSLLSIYVKVLIFSSRK